MHTLKILALGFVLLGSVLALIRFSGRWLRASHPALFISGWCLICFASAVSGIQAGYSISLEGAVFALTFGLPSGLAWLITRQPADPNKRRSTVSITTAKTTPLVAFSSHSAQLPSQPSYRA
jgi:hypothetical protein